LKNRITPDDVTDAIKEVIDKNDFIRLSYAEEKELALCLFEKRKPRKEHLQRAYDMAQDIMKEEMGKEIKFDDDVTLIPMYLTSDAEKQNKRYFVSGISGAGKSVWINRLIKVFLSTQSLIEGFKPQVFVFSALPEDESLDCHLEKVLERIPCDESILEHQENKDQYKPSDFEGPDKNRQNIVVFDDFSSITNSKVLKIIEKLRNDCLTTARHSNLNVVTVSHELMAGDKTKSSISNSTDVVVFPQAGNSSQIARFLKTYMNFQPSEIKKLLELDSRWVLISKTCPQYILYEHGVYLVE
jgi:hypothetical protein